MSVIDALITDRSASDVLSARRTAERILNGTASAEGIAAYLAGMKGAYNASDLNRVGEACAYLYARFTRYGYAVPGYEALPTDWAVGDIPTAAQMRTYLATVKALKDVWGSEIPLPDAMDAIGFEDANDIERLLAEIEWLIIHLVYAFRRSAEFGFYSGEAFIPTANDDLGRTWAELDAMETEWANWNAATWFLLLYGNMKAEA